MTVRELIAKLSELPCQDEEVCISFPDMGYGDNLLSRIETVGNKPITIDPYMHKHLEDYDAKLPITCVVISLEASC